MENPINWKLISHPVNWVVILLMLIIAGTAGVLLADFIGLKASTANVDPNLAVGQVNIGVVS
jgi:hypothetical protein